MICAGSTTIQLELERLAIDRDGVGRITQRINEHLTDGGVLVFASHYEVAIENLQRIELA